MSDMNVTQIAFLDLTVGTLSMKTYSNGEGEVTAIEDGLFVVGPEHGPLALHHLDYL